MSESRNAQLHSLDRIAQFEQMGVRRLSYAKLIFALECFGYMKEAKTMLYAATNLYLNPKYPLLFFRRYSLMLLEKDETFFV